MEGLVKPQRDYCRNQRRWHILSFNPLAFGASGWKSLKQQGTVVEFAIRKAKSEDAFGEPRDTFFDSLDSFDGYKFAREFKVYTLNEKGIPADTQAVIIVWENPDKFSRLNQYSPAKPIRNSPNSLR